MVRFGFIGTSMISDKFAEALKQTEGCVINSVYSRTFEKGKLFAEKHGIKNIFTSLDEMLESNLVDAVYIASPNGAHAEQAIKVMGYKKHVLCEKSIAGSTKELDMMIETAEKNGVLLMEAMRITLNPNFKIIKENLHKIGKIRGVKAEYCQYSSRYDNLKRGELTNIFDPKLAGGAVYDIGVYPLYFVTALFGEPQEYVGVNYAVSSGADGLGNIVMKYPDKIASVFYSKISEGKAPSEIQGELGSILIDKISFMKEIKILYRDGREEEIGVPVLENDMVYEAREFISLINEGKTESSVNTLAVSRKVLEIMENTGNKSSYTGM